MKQKILVDVTVTCDPPSYINRWNRSIEQREKMMIEWVNEFHDFIRDHRSQDPVNLNVERVYQEQCSHCHNEWESGWDTDPEGPACCSAAVAEWEASRAQVPA